MAKNDPKPIERLVKSFAFRLKKDFGAEIRKDPSKFKARVVGTLKAMLPRRKRQGNPEVKKGAEIYVNLYAAKGLPGNWHELAKRLVPDYASLSPEMQRYHRFRLRSQTHSYLYDQRSRLRRSREHCSDDFTATSRPGARGRGPAQAR